MPAIPRRQVECVAEAALPTRFGQFRILVYRVAGDPLETIALVYGQPSTGFTPLVRLHSECLTGEALGSLRCDCGEQLNAALSQIAAAGCGVLLYLRQEGRGIGLANKIRAYALQDTGLDTVDANVALGLPIDAREYGSAAAVLLAMGIRRVRLLTNNPAKLAALGENGVAVEMRVPLEISANSVNRGYLLAKAGRLGHLLTQIEQADTQVNSDGAIQA